MGVLISRVKQKPLKNQVIVITGATSGIGLATAQLAAQKGARLVLVARNEVALKLVSQELDPTGDRCLTVKADVANEDDVKRVSTAAKTHFGGFDTWINNAGVTLYGELLNCSLDDEQRLMDVNFWGVVYGSKEAADHLKSKGGTIINIGSVASNRAVPLQGTYCASKHAIKAFTEVLRMELEKDAHPVSVSLILPASASTPYTEHAKNLMNQSPALPPPLYDPYVVAKTILTCAQKKVLRIGVGGIGYVPITLMEKITPGLADRLMEKYMFRLQTKKEVPTEREGTLYHPSTNEGHVYGQDKMYLLRSSLFTYALLHKSQFFASLIGAAALAALFYKNGRLRQGAS